LGLWRDLLEVAQFNHAIRDSPSSANFGVVRFWTWIDFRHDVRALRADKSRIWRKLVLPDTLRVPNGFELYIPKRRCFYYARLIRHESECIGVKFYHADAKMAPDPHLSEFET
jgi:hypothetical protein